MTGHQRDITQATSVALALNIALHLLLLPRFGLEGAAFSSMTMLVTWNLILWFRVKQRLRIRYYL
jgi:O-antigen/teichoic acid export membrane protein